jgi:hypothetical protein
VSIKQDCPPHRYVDGRCINRAARTDGNPEGIRCNAREPVPLIAYPKYSYVVEGTTKPCTNCGDTNGAIGFWFDAEWTPGAFPDRGRPPRLVLCKSCLDAGDVGQLVGPELRR